MRTFWLIRHGESEADVGLPIADPAMVALTAHGRDQAAHIADFFEQPPELIVTSPYLRAVQTAEPTLRRFPGVPREDWPVHEFTCVVARTPWDSPAARRSRVEAYWERYDPSYCDGDGAESFNTLIARVRSTLHRLDQRPERTVAVFTHGQLIRALLWRLIFESMPLHPEAMRRFALFSYAVTVRNGAIVPVLRSPDGWSVGRVIVRHLVAEA